MANISVDKTCCKGCDICIAICPKKVFVASKKRNTYGTNMPEPEGQANCVYCGMCERMCPDGAINVEREKEGEVVKNEN